MHACANCGGIDAIELPYWSDEFGGWMVVCSATGRVAWLHYNVTPIIGANLGLYA